jgi:hypothetical protein
MSNARLLAILLALAVGLTGCGGTPSTAAPNGSAAASPAQSDSPSIEEAIDALADAGVGVYDGPTSATPVREPVGAASPFRLLHSQVENLARDAAAGGGIGADQIDALLPMPDGSVPFSFILAGYVAASQTAGADHARALMADQDLEQPASLLFPTLVLAMFVGEVTAAADTAAVEMASLERSGVRLAIAGGPGSIRLAATDVCADFSGFVKSTLQAVSAAIITVLPDIPFLKTAISWALTKGIALGLDAAAGLIELIPFIGALRTAIGAIALAVTVVAALRDWTVPVTVQPGLAHYSVGATVGLADAIGTVDDGPGDVFSPEVRSCAALLGISLAKGGAEGSIATWSVVAGSNHASPSANQQTTVGADRRTTLRLVMSREPEDVHDSATIANGLVVLRVTVKRQDVEQVKTFIEKAITGVLPEPVYKAVTGTFGDPLSKITAMVDINGQGRLVAEYHLPDETPPPASPSPSPSLTPDPNAFCKKYAAMIAWAIANQSGAGAQAYVAEIQRRLHDMRPDAPASMRGAVDIHIAVYDAVVAGAGAAVVGELAEPLPGAAARLANHCDVDPGPLGGM